MASALALSAAAALPAVGQSYPAGQGDYQATPEQGRGGPQGYGPEGYGQDPGGGPNARNMTLQQFQARQVSNIMRMDADHAGRVSLAEWTAWHEAHPGRGGRGDPARAFERLDLNHDGYITPDEVTTVAARRYARMQNGGGMGRGGPDQGGLDQGGGYPPSQQPGPQ